jgi:ABC-2 type transport system permease protein
MMRQAVAVARKELRQVRRDRRTLLILLFVPALFLLLYGYALSFDIRNVALAVSDRDGSPQSRALVSAFVNSGYFDLAAEFRSREELDRLFDHNEARAALVIPAEYGERVLNRQPVNVQVIVDGSNANTAATVVGYAEAIIADAAVGVSMRAAAPPIEMVPRVWYNPQLRSALFLVPGLIAYIVMITAVVSTSLSVVREKERGTMEQVRMAPVSPLVYIGGKAVPYLVLSFASALLIIAAAMLLFDLPMRGSWLLLGGVILLFVVGAQAQGLLISTIAPSQQVAFQLALLSSFLPTLVLSGFIFPISSMPPAIQAVTLVIPARYFIAALAIFAVVMLAISAIRLAKEWS